MPRRFGAALPPRVGLVAATLLLAACGLTASGIAVTSILRHSLIKRVDQTLQEGSRRSWAQAPLGTSAARRGPTMEGPPSNFYLRAISPDGRTWTVVNDSNAQPALPANNDVGRKPKTIGSVDNSGVEWRGGWGHGGH